MNIDTAKQIIGVAFQCSSQLQELMATLKGQCSEQEYKIYAMAIAASIDKIGTELIDKALRSHPELTEEIEVQLRETGRFVP